MGFLSREIRVDFHGESQLQQSRATQPTEHAGCFCVYINPPKSDMDYRIFNMRTDVNACGCTQGCTDTVRESALKADSERKNPLPHRGIEPASAACRSDALATELHPPPADWLSLHLPSPPTPTKDTPTLTPSRPTLEGKGTIKCKQ